MEGFEDDSFSERAKLHKGNRIVTPRVRPIKRQEDPQNEVRGFFKELMSWRANSEAQFMSITNSYSNRIRKSIHSLTEANNNLQDQLSVTTKERDNLIEAVEKSGEINYFSTKLSLPKTVHTPYQNTEEEANSHKVETEYAQQHGAQGNKVTHDTVEKEHKYNEDSANYIHEHGD